MQALAPIAITGVDIDVPLVADGIQAAWTPGQIRCANETPYALQCILGADVHWLQPWSVDVWPVHGVTSMHVHPVSLVTPVPTPQWSTLLVTVAQAFEAFPGVYPAALDRQSAAFYNRQKLFPDGVATPVNPATPSFTVAAGVTAPFRFTLPAGTVDVRILATAGGLLFGYSLLVLGHQTVEQYYGDPQAPGTPLAVPVPTLPFTIPIERDWDSQLDFTVVGDPAQATSYFLSALFAPETPGQAGASQSVTMPTPQPWQAPTLSAPFSANFVAGVAQVEINATAGSTVFVHSIFVVTNAATNVSVQDTTGSGFSQGSAQAAGIALQVDHKGQPLTRGRGVQIVSLVNAALNGVIVYGRG